MRSIRCLIELEYKHPFKQPFVAYGYGYGYVNHQENTIQ